MIHEIHQSPNINLLSLSLSLSFRVQTRISSTNPRTPCPAGSTSLWPPTTPCPCRRSQTQNIDPQWTSCLLNCCAQGPKSLLDCYAAASASPPSLNTWRPPQGRRRSRGTSQTPSCRAARTAVTTTTQKPALYNRTAIRSPFCNFTYLKISSVLFRCCCRVRVTSHFHVTGGPQRLLFLTIDSTAPPQAAVGSCSRVPSSPQVLCNEEITPTQLGGKTVENKRVDSKHTYTYCGAFAASESSVNCRLEGQLIRFTCEELSAFTLYKNCTFRLESRKKM